MVTREKRDKNHVQSAAKVFLILETLAKHDGRMRITHLVEELRMPMSTVFRFVSSLVSLGYLNQDAETGEYVLGIRLLSLSSVVLRQLDLRRVARPYLERIRDATGETANLVVLDSDEVLYVEKVEGRAAIRVFSLIGKRAPVHATGAGKVLLADMAYPDVMEILTHKGMPRLTPHTITDVDTLMEELNMARSKGYALDRQECEPGAVCIAVPVRNHTGRAIAAVSVSGPYDRLPEARILELVPIVKDLAAQISRALGHNDQYALSDASATQDGRSM